MKRNLRNELRRLGPCLAVTLFAASTAGAAPMPRVFHSASGTGNDEPAVGQAPALPSGTNVPVHLYLKRSEPGMPELASSGTVCDPANDPPGDEICGADVMIAIECGDSATMTPQCNRFFSGFTPGSGVEYTFVSGPAGNQLLRMAVPRADPLNLPDQTPFFLGTAMVDRTDLDPLHIYVLEDQIGTQLIGNQIVNAKRELEDIPNEIIAVPEPGVWLQLPAALLGLAGLHRLRERRARRAR